MRQPVVMASVYKHETLVDIWTTALTAFYGAVSEAKACNGDTSECTTHTGWRGTGAYGGNRTPMAIMQVIAARAAGVTRLVFHTVDSAGATDFAAACALPGLDTFRHSETLDPEALLQFCAARSFRWDTLSELDSVITFGHATGATIRM